MLALAFAWGTNTWMISSQALWQHGAGELLIALALLLGISPATRWNAAALGAVCVLIAANRPPDALIAGAIVLHAMWTRRRTVPWLLAGGVVLFAPLLFYNLNVAGSVAGGYGKTTIHGAEGAAVLSLFQNSVWEGVAGLLVSPTRGLLIFSPFLIFVPLGLRQRLRNPTTRGLAIALSIGVVAQLLLYSLTDWRGGTSWGPRYLTDTLPVLVWLLAPATLVLKALGRAFFVLAMAASVIIQGIGAFWYTGTSEGIIFGRDPTSMRAAWDFKNLPFLVELRHPPARGELQCNTTTAFDSIGGTPPNPVGPTPLLTSGSVIEGWALACGRTPAEIFLLIDGVIIGSTQHFTSRPDVNRTMHTKSASGWTVPANTRGVSPGEHVMQLALRLEPVPTSQPRIVREQRVLIAASASDPGQTLMSPARLSDMANRAASALRASQSEAGYWLTSHTVRPQFDKPLVEFGPRRAGNYTVIAQFSLRRYVRAMTRFASTRATEVIVLQGSAILGAVLGCAGHDGLALGRIALVIAGSLVLTAHVYLFNGWAGQSSDLNDPRRSRNVFGSREISSREVASLVVGLLVVAMLLLALVGVPALLCGAAIAALSFVCSGSASWGKGRPIMGSVLHLIGGTFHFLLGYSASHAIDARGVAIAIFFGLVFAGGHLNQEVRDYDADLRSQIRTNAVAFGCRRTFISSLLIFTAAYLLLGVLVSLGILARPLIWATLFWPWHVASSLRALRHGLGFEAAVSMQRRYRLQFAALGLAMLLTATPVTEFARRVHAHATTTRFAARSE